MKLIFGADFDHVLSGSSGPDIAIFKRFQEYWPFVDRECFQPASTDPHIKSLVTSGRSEIAEFTLNQLQVQHPRNDYQELLELSCWSLELGQVLPKKLMVAAMDIPAPDHPPKHSPIILVTSKDLISSALQTGRQYFVFWSYRWHFLQKIHLNGVTMRHIINTSALWKDWLSQMIKQREELLSFKTSVRSWHMMKNNCSIWRRLSVITVDSFQTVESPPWWWPSHLCQLSSIDSDTDEMSQWLESCLMIMFTVTVTTLYFSRCFHLSQ